MAAGIHSDQALATPESIETHDELVKQVQSGDAAA